MQPSFTPLPFVGSSRNIPGPESSANIIQPNGKHNSRTHPGSQLPQVQPDAINVDEEYTCKYEVQSDEIIAIDANTYRQSLRERSKSNGKEKQQNGVKEEKGEAPRHPPSLITAEEIIRKNKHELSRNRAETGRDMISSGGTQLGPNYPSTIGPAIEVMKRNRSMAPQQQSASTSTPNKRRKIDHNVSSSGVLHQPAAGPSRSHSHHASVNRGQTATARPQAHYKRPHEVIELSSDDEVVQLISPAKKKRKAIPTPLPNKTPIEISSDSDVDFTGVVPVKKPISSPVLKPKREPDLSEEDEDDDWIPPGFDLNDPHTWKPLNTDHDVYLNNTLTQTLEQLDISSSQPERPPIRHIPPDVSQFDPRPRQRKHDREPLYVWDKLAQAVNVRIPPRPRPTAYQVTRPYMPAWKEDFDLYRLKRAFYDPNGFYELKKAPGSIGRVVQKGNWTVIGSGCLGGLPDVPDEEPSPYNREGSLMTLRHELDIPRGHEVKKSDYTKYYAVNDVQFDPLRKAFVSTGADCRLRLWSLQGDDEDEEDEDPNTLGQGLPPLRPRWTNRTLKPYNSVPHDLAFKPGTSILAVAEKQVRIYSLSQAVPEPLGNLPVYPADAPHIVGAMAWGADPTSSNLFVSSEPLDPTCFVGMHRVYDLQEKKPIYSFDAKEAGDTLCVGPIGRTLALSTRGEGNRHILRLYDIARRNGKATSTVDLEPFPVRYPGFEGEVNSSTFSPDGLFLALARNDNRTDVYDLRFTHRGPLYQYHHSGECQASNKNCLFGVVKAQWLQSVRSRRVALVTGGEDGCVRVWDPSLSAEDLKNGVAIAHVNSDIGHFSLGDTYSGEHQLVVGDCSGEISVFDNNI